MDIHVHLATTPAAALRARQRGATMSQKARKTGTGAAARQQLANPKPKAKLKAKKKTAGRKSGTVEEALPTSLDGAFRLKSSVLLPWVGFGKYRMKNRVECTKESDTCVVGSVKKALRCGYRLIETAHVYKNARGIEEAVKAAGAAAGTFMCTEHWRSHQGWDEVDGETSSRPRPTRA